MTTTLAFLKSKIEKCKAAEFSDQLMHGQYGENQRGHYFIIDLINSKFRVIVLIYIKEYNGVDAWFWTSENGHRYDDILCIVQHRIVHPVYCTSTKRTSATFVVILFLNNKY